MRRRLEALGAPVPRYAPGPEGIADAIDWAALALNRAEAEHARDRLAEAFRQLDADLITDRWRIVYGLTIPPAIREWWWWR